MNPSILVTQKSTKKKGRPATGQMPGRSVRLPDELWNKIDDWRARQRPIPARSEAIRQLVESGFFAELLKEMDKEQAAKALVAEKKRRA